MFDYRFQWRVVFRHWPELLDAAFLTLQITTLSILMGLVIGMVLSVWRRSDNPVLYWSTATWVALARNTPALLQIYLAYFGLGAFGLHLSSYTAVLAAITFNNAGYLAELAMEAGLPRGVLNVVTGTGPDVGEPLGRHMDVDLVSFTGSTATGRRFLQYASDSNLKEVVLEMGGKNPCIVLDDAENLDRVAAHVVNGAFWNIGQNCSAASRLIVEKEIKNRLLELMFAHLREWPVGDPLDPQNRIGVLVSKDHFDKVCSYLEGRRNVLFGGETHDGTFVQPTVIDSESRNDPLAHEEIFGPVLSVFTVKGLDEVIAVANDTEYGLTASIFTANCKRALRSARALRAGTVTVNCFGEGDITTPFGGYRQSGFGGRYNSLHAHDQYTQIKTVWIDLGDQQNEAV